MDDHSLIIQDLFQVDDLGVVGIDLCSSFALIPESLIEILVQVQKNARRDRVMFVTPLPVPGRWGQEETYH